MLKLKKCDLCECSSDETAIFTCAYAKGDLNICLECLTEGVLEVTKHLKKPQKNPNSERTSRSESNIIMPIEEFIDLNIPEEVFGFNCENCGSVLFSNSFPIICDCGHVNQESVLVKQDLMNQKR